MNKSVIYNVELCWVISGSLVFICNDVVISDNFGTSSCIQLINRQHVWYIIIVIMFNNKWKGNIILSGRQFTLSNSNERNSWLYVFIITCVRHVTHFNKLNQYSILQWLIPNAECFIIILSLKVLYQVH